ncbi:histidine phosphatase family protein [Mycobacterium sp. M1]|uniref:Histidine phosphatase family protein n=1 Tax=Mycolicibacter acidiphilus TaxID=2835306 RepID=A0ABS5RQW3_9MYCO|nr:histidine phosphatase family protein [Mycolicibacter acidiphilus]MBS9535354.1 histidine phosphatase family protein [Mycolicibacter acidiphilus]
MTTSARTLLLLRHAKSDYPAGSPDHERPLANRGIREAKLAGDWLRANAPGIDLVLCSTATRTRQTLQRTGITAPVDYRDGLYDAVPGAVIAEINGVTDDVHTLLVVGHEPAMSRVALGLAGPGSHATVAQQISAKYPTSGIAVLRIEGSWRALELGGATLTDFHVPR